MVTTNIPLPSFSLLYFFLPNFLVVLFYKCLFPWLVGAAFLLIAFDSLCFSHYSGFLGCILYCCPDCPSHPANVIRIGQAIWALMKKYSLMNETRGKVFAPRLTLIHNLDENCHRGNLYLQCYLKKIYNSVLSNNEKACSFATFAADADHIKVCFKIWYRKIHWKFNFGSMKDFVWKCACV